MSENIYNPKKLTDELLAAALPVASVSSSGRVSYSRDLTAAEKKTADLAIKAHDPSPTDDVVIKDQYANAGITTDKLLYALWKKIMQDDSKDADALQALIEQVHTLVHV